MAEKPSFTDAELTNLVAYLDGELDPQAARAVEAKLTLNTTARGEAEALRQTWALLDYLPRPEASVTFTSQTLDRVSVLRPITVPNKVSRRRRPWAFGAGWAAAVLLAGVVGFGGVDLATQKHRSLVPAAGEPADPDEHLARDLRLIENKRVYEQIEDMSFLRELDDPDLFGDDG